MKRSVTHHCTTSSIIEFARPLIVNRLATPIRRQHSLSHEAMEARIGPVHHSRRISMLHRVVVDIVNVRLQIAFVPYQVLPIPPLPDATFPFGPAAARSAFTGWEGCRKRCLDPPPSRWKIRIAGRQCPHSVQMIGQHHDCIDVKWMGLSSVSKGFAQGFNMIDQQRFRTLRQSHRKEIRRPWNSGTDVVRHAG